MLLVLATAALSAQAGTIRGKVIHSADQATGAHTVVVADSHLGQRFFAVTDQTGAYVFKNLSQGFYTVWLEKDGDFETESPICGFYHQYLEDVLNLPFRTRPTGVMVDFGDPNGGGSSPKMATTFRDFSIYMDGLEILDPDTIEMAGYWYAPGQGSLTGTIINGLAAGPYVGSGVNVSYASVGGNQTKYTLQLSTGMAINGEMASFTMSLSTADQQLLDDVEGQMAFCGSYVRMYKHGNVIFDSNTNWMGNEADFATSLTSREVPRR